MQKIESRTMPGCGRIDMVAAQGKGDQPKIGKFHAIPAADRRRRGRCRIPIGTFLSTLGWLHDRVIPDKFTQLIFSKFITTLIDNPSDSPELSPRATAEHILEQSRRGLMEDRFDLFRSCVAIPTLVETFEASREIRSEEELLAAFHAVRRYYSSLRVTHLDRRCIAAESSGPGRISFTYESRLLEGPRLVQEPYPVFSDAVLDSGLWKVVRSSYAIVDQAQHIKALTGEG